MSTSHDAVPEDSKSTGCSKMSQFEMIKKHRRNASLVDKFKELEVLRNIIEKQKIDIQNQLRQVQDSGPTPEAEVIAFVKAIERAKKYFEFKGYLKREGLITHDSVLLEVFENLVKDKKVQESFKELEFQDIMDAVDENIVDLQIEQDRIYCELEGLTYSEEDDKRFTLLELAEASGRRIPNPFIDLVYRIHEKGYVMDQDPLVELNIIMKNHQVFYIKCFMGGLVVKNSEKKVIVEDIPLGYDEDKVRASLSACGDIEHVKMESRYGWINSAARVTFCSAEGAKLAPFLLKNGHFTISPELEERRAETNTELIEEYIRARSKYEEFRNSAKNLSKQNQNLSKLNRRRRRRQRLKCYACDGSNICSEDQPIPKMPNSNIS